MNHSVDLLIITGIGDNVTTNVYGAAVGGLPPPMRTIGPSKIANQVRKAGYTCQIIDFFEYFTQEELLFAVQKFLGPGTILGISTTFFPQTMWSRPDHDKRSIELQSLIKICKQKFKTKILVGGPSAQNFKNVFQADFCLIGYAENEIVKILDSVKNHGISKKRIDRWEITTCQHRWHSSSCIVPGEALPLEVGRGCIFHCKFCRFEMLGKKKGTYLRSMEYIRDEIIFNYDNFKVNKYLIVDDTFNDDQDKMKAWFDMVLSLPFKIYYTAYLRTDLLHRFQKTARSLYETGLIGASLGIETLHPVAAKAIGKAWSAKHGQSFVPELIHDIWEDKVVGRINLMTGLPGEPKTSYEHTVRWLESNNLKCPLFTPLSILPPKSDEKDPNILRSIFDKEASNYGYQVNFPNKSRSYWKTSIMDYDEANELALKLNKHFEETAQIGNWRAMALMGVGISLDYILNTPRSTIMNSNTVTNSIHNFVDHYKDLLL